MLKKKYLHRKSRKDYGYHWKPAYKRSNTIDLFSDLPKREKIRSLSSYYRYDLTPLREFIFSKIGENWNDVYSEILTKVDKRIRYDIDQSLFHSYSSWLVCFPIYDDDFIPRDKYGRILADRTFVDMNNILTRKCEYEIISDAKKFVRKQKIKEILDKNKEDDINIFE